MKHSIVESVRVNVLLLEGQGSIIGSSNSFNLQAIELFFATSATKDGGLLPPPRLIHYCKRCLIGYREIGALTKHAEYWSKNDAQKIELPSPGPVISFSKHSRSMPFPWCVFAEFESNNILVSSFCFVEFHLAWIIVHTSSGKEMMLHNITVDFVTTLSKPPQ